jgi:hypothetical protein
MESLNYPPGDHPKHEKVKVNPDTEKWIYVGTGTAPVRDNQ